MQPRIAEIKYVENISLEALNKEVNDFLSKTDAHWEFFGDLKKFDKTYIQGLIRLEFENIMQSQEK